MSEAAEGFREAGPVLRRALAVAFVGIDGSGKTTLIERVGQRLRAGGVMTHELKARTGRSGLEKLGRRQDLPKLGDLFGPEATTLMMASLAWQAIGEAKQLRRTPDAVLLFDRYMHCALALTRILSPAAESKVRCLFQRLPPADLIYFLDTPIDIAQSRAASRGASQKSLAFLRSFDCAYRSLPEWSGMIALDGRQSTDCLAERVVSDITGHRSRYGVPSTIPHEAVE